MKTPGPAARAVTLVASGIFDSYMVYEREGTWMVAGGSQATITVDAKRIRLRHQGTERSWLCQAHHLSRLGEVLGELPIPDWTAYGWVAFEMAHLLAGQPERAGADELGHLVVPEAEVRIDAEQTSIICADGRLRDRIDDLLASAAQRAFAVRTIENLDLASEWYPPAVADAVQEVRKGSFRKVILSRSVPISTAIDFAETYLLGRQANTPARSFLFDLGNRRATGFCPETILEVAAGGMVSTQPLAGTRSFGDDEQENNRLRAELLGDPKEIYEHALALQLAYEELSGFCKPGTVAVTELMSVVRRGSLQHLSSRVRGDLADDVTCWDALEAAFPAVAACGIPKEAARDYIARTEKTPRGLYSGAVLTASHDGALDAGLILRSVYEEYGNYRLQAGAGIVGASRPEREYEETHEKLRSIAPYLVPVSNPNARNQQKETP